MKVVDYLITVIILTSAIIAVRAAKYGFLTRKTYKFSFKELLSTVVELLLLVVIIIVTTIQIKL